MPNVREWQAELYEIADRLEAGALRWRLSRSDRGLFDARSALMLFIHGNFRIAASAAGAC